MMLLSPIILIVVFGSLMLTHMRHPLLEFVRPLMPFAGTGMVLLGMVQMFANMTDPSKLGPFMAVALLATLYGALVANILCLPIADKLHGKLNDEEVNRTLIIDGVMMLRESKSPQIVREMLLAYIPEQHRPEPEAVPA